MTIKAIAHTDVHGLESYYLKVRSNRNNEVLIKVGSKNYQAIQQLVEEEQTPQERLQDTKIK